MTFYANEENINNILLR